jgi:hypothetical protein
MNNLPWPATPWERSVCRPGNVDRLSTMIITGVNDEGNLIYRMERGAGEWVYIFGDDQIHQLELWVQQKRFVLNEVLVVEMTAPEGQQHYHQSISWIGMTPKRLYQAPRTEVAETPEEKHLNNLVSF